MYKRVYQTMYERVYQTMYERVYQTMYERVYQTMYERFYQTMYERVYQTMYERVYQTMYERVYQTMYERFYQMMYERVYQTMYERVYQMMYERVYQTMYERVYQMMYERVYQTMYERVNQTDGVGAVSWSGPCELSVSHVNRTHTNNSTSCWSNLIIYQSPSVNQTGPYQILIAISMCCKTWTLPHTNRKLFVFMLSEWRVATVSQPQSNAVSNCLVCIWSEIHFY